MVIECVTNKASGGPTTFTNYIRMTSKKSDLSKSHGSLSNLSSKSFRSPYMAKPIPTLGTNSRSTGNLVNQALSSSNRANTEHALNRPRLIPPNQHVRITWKTTKSQSVNLLGSNGSLIKDLPRSEYYQSTIPQIDFNQHKFDMLKMCQNARKQGKID